MASYILGPVADYLGRLVSRRRRVHKVRRDLDRQRPAKHGTMTGNMRARRGMRPFRLGSITASAIDSIQ